MESDSLPSWQIDKLIEEVIRPYSDVLWIEGAPPPLLKEYKASIKLKPGASGVVRQPYKLSKSDELRASYHHEVWEREGKIEYLKPGDPQIPFACSTFMVDKPPPDLLGRCVTDYVPINEITEDVAFPAPDAERSFNIASCKEYHSTLDAVRGFQQMENDAETAEILTITTKKGVARCRRFPFGPKKKSGHIRPSDA